MNSVLEFVLKIILKLGYRLKTFIAKPTKGEYLPEYSTKIFQEIPKGVFFSYLRPTDNHKNIFGNS